MKTILTNSRFFKSVRMKEADLVIPDRMLLYAATAYARTPGQPGFGRLLQTINIFGKSDSGEGVLYRTSEDNGETWTEQYVMDRPYQAGPNKNMMRKIAADCFYDEEAQVMVRISGEMLWENDELLSIFKKRRMFYMLSFDNGRTWTDPIYIYKDGGGFDRDRMFPGVAYGINIMCSVLKTYQIRGEGPHRGKLAIGVQIQMADEQGEIINPTGMGFFKAGCLLGTWNKETLRYEWELSDNFAEVTVEESTRGVYEPALQELPDGRIMMVLRGSNWRKEEELIGTKWISVSSDQGRTWSRPVRWTYSDGSVMYSSSCSPDLVRDREGNLYFVGVINDANPAGNLPRYPLCIAKVDPGTMGVIKESVTLLDTIREGHKNELAEAATPPKYPVDYSNHYSYLDQNGQKIIVYAPYRPTLHSFSSVINRYEIELA